MQTLRQSSTGSDVRTWQKIIGVEQDGSFGPLTEQATKRWQAAHDLVPDGVVGPATWGKAGIAPKKPTGSMRARARAIIAVHEGRRAKVYLDQYGHPTIGIGFNLDRPDARGRIEALGLDYDAVRAGDVALTDAQIDRLFDGDFNASLAAARDLLPNFAGLTTNAQIVMIDMVFNMGKEGVAGFSRMLSALARKDYAGAVDGIKGSRYASQVPSRAAFNMDLLVTPDTGWGLGTLILLAAAGYATLRLWKG
jgi:peptidoglycan hydrolase-like protein with peptidoglycan-binding domain